MVDVKKEHEAAEAARRAGHVQRTADRLESLAARYVDLAGHVRAGGRRGGGDDVPFHAPAGPRVPLRVDVVDVREEVALFVRDFLPRVRLVMRLRHVLKGAGDVVPGLLLMARMLPGVYGRQPVLGEEISRAAWDLERRAAWAAGEVPRPFPLTEACEACGVRALWVVPERLMIRCGNPACGRQESVASVMRPGRGISVPVIEGSIT